MSADPGGAVADEWMRIARKDRRRAERNLKDRDPEAAGFFLQQSLEKYLKAFLLKHNWKLRKIHELDALLDEAAKFKQDLETHRDLCERVSGYYMAERYPPSHRQIGRHRYKQMDMVLTYVPLHYLYIVRLQISRTSSRTRVPTAPLSTARPYLVIQTKSYFRSYFV